MENVKATNSSLFLNTAATGYLQVVNEIVGSTLTVQGNAFSVGGSTFVVSGGAVGINTTPSISAALFVNQNNVNLGILVSSSTAGQLVSARVAGSPIIEGLTNGGAANTLAINPLGGNVGIGSTSTVSVLDVVTGGTTVLTMGAATTFFPTLSCPAGSYTTATSTGTYLRSGKSVNYQVTISLVAAGTCGSGFRFTIPHTLATQCVMAMYESATTGFAGVGYAASGSTFAVSLYGQQNVDISGYIFNFTGTCQIQ